MTCPCLVIPAFITTVSTWLAEVLSSSSKVTTTVSRPEVKSVDDSTVGSLSFNQLSALAREQSWASLHRLGTSIPALGSALLMASVRKPLSGTSNCWQVRASAPKYTQGLCLGAYSPLGAVEQLASIESA